MKAGQNIMKIQTDRVAYYFPTPKRLVEFIKKNGDRIHVPDNMRMVYGVYASTTFNFWFRDTDGLYHWAYSSVDWYLSHNYKVIMYAKQRTE